MTQGGGGEEDSVRVGIGVERRRGVVTNYHYCVLANVHMSLDYVLCTLISSTSVSCFFSILLSLFLGKVAKYSQLSIYARLLTKMGTSAASKLNSSTKRRGGTIYFHVGTTPYAFVSQASPLVTTYSVFR